MFYEGDIQPDCCRELLGDDLVFMNLSMGKEDKIKRLLARHGGDEHTVSMFDVSSSVVIVCFVIILVFGVLRVVRRRCRPGVTRATWSRSWSPPRCPERRSWRRF